MATQPRPTWTAQLRALWAGSAAVRDRPAGPAAPPVRQAWPLERVRLAERLWGAGFLDPFDAGMVLETVRPLALTPETRVLEIGAGLGGPARVLAKATGASVHGVEADAVLAGIAAARCRAANLCAPIRIEPFDAERAEFAPGFDAAIVRGGLVGVSRKNELIEALARALRPGSPLLILDLVLRHSGRLGRLIEDWCRAEPGPVHPWALGQLIDRLKSRGFTISAADDLSEEYVAAGLAGWRRFQASLRSLAPDDAVRAALFRESAIWAKRLAALEAGELRVYGFTARAPRRH
jgi:cyclopropane fatty-acyl-phospholipid synthase-like methyltransferase